MTALDFTSEAPINDHGAQAVSFLMLDFFKGAFFLKQWKQKPGWLGYNYRGLLYTTQFYLDYNKPI